MFEISIVLSDFYSIISCITINIKHKAAVQFNNPYFQLYLSAIKRPACMFPIATRNPNDKNRFINNVIYPFIYDVLKPSHPNISFFFSNKFLNKIPKTRDFVLFFIGKVFYFQHSCRKNCPPNNFNHLLVKTYSLIIHFRVSTSYDVSLGA